MRRLSYRLSSHHSVSSAIHGDGHGIYRRGLRPWSVRLGTQWMDQHSGQLYENSQFYGRILCFRSYAESSYCDDNDNQGAYALVFLLLRHGR